MLAGIALSAAIPFIGFALLRATTKLSTVDAAAVAAHYGSISIVTFVAATQSLTTLGIPYEGYLVAVAAVMETPAILTALLLARRGRSAEQRGEHEQGASALMREIGLNGSVVMLVGSFIIGWITGDRGMKAVSPFVNDLVFGMICLFLLDMGLIAGRGMRDGLKSLSWSAIGFGLYMPIISAALAGLLGLGIGLSLGGTALLITLGGFGLLHRGAGRDAPRAPGGETIDLSHAVARRDLPVQPDARHSALCLAGVSGERLRRR